MIKVTDNKEVKETVLAGLKRNKEKKIQYVCVKSLGKWKKGLAIANFMLKLKTNNYG